MASCVITNLTASPLLIQDLYTTIAASSAITVERSATDLPRMKSLQAAIAAAKASLAVTYSADELASGLQSPPASVGADDAAPVAAATVQASGIDLRAIFTALAAGTADDVTVFAVNTFPFKVRVLDVYGYVSTNIAASTWALRTAAAGGGTLIATLSANATGRVLDATLTTTTVVTPGGAVGLFVRRSDRGTAGEVVLHCRRET